MSSYISHLYRVITNLASQSYPPTPTFTEKQCPDLSGKVYIVTGGASGVGFELSKILYAKNATVYVAGRSRDNALKAINEIKSHSSSSDGRLEFLHLDLSDLATISKSAQDFLSRESRLDVLWNNAGVMAPPGTPLTPQSHDLQLGTNCLGPLLFTLHLIPLLTQTAKTAPTGTVRVVWAGSLVVDLQSPKYGIDMTDLAYKNGGTPEHRYAQSKAGNYFISHCVAKRMSAASTGVLSVCMNPGNLKTSLARHMPSFMRTVLNLTLLHPPVYGAYTELFAGLSEQVTPEKNGSYISPWGRFHNLERVRPDIVAGTKSTGEGGTDVAEKFYSWCEEEIKPYL